MLTSQIQVVDSFVVHRLQGRGPRYTSNGAASQPIVRLPGCVPLLALVLDWRDSLTQANNGAASAYGNEPASGDFQQHESVLVLDISSRAGADKRQRHAVHQAFTRTARGGSKGTGRKKRGNAERASGGSTDTLRGIKRATSID